MDATETHEIYDALKLFSRIGKVMTEQIDGGKTRIFIEGCIKAGGGLTLPCEAFGDNVNEVIIQLLWDLQDLPEGHYVMNAKGSRLRLVNNMWSRIDRTK